MLGGIAGEYGVMSVCVPYSCVFYLVESFLKTYEHFDAIIDSDMCMYVCVYRSVCVCMYVCTCACVHVCGHVRVCISEVHTFV